MWSDREIMCYKYLYFSLSQRQEEPNIRHELTPSFRSSVWWIQTVNGWINNVHSAGSYAVSHREDKEQRRRRSIRQQIALLNRFFLAIRTNRVAKHVPVRKDSIESANRVLNRFDSNDPSEWIKLTKARNQQINLTARGAPEDKMIMMISWISITTPQLVWQSFNWKKKKNYFTVQCFIGSH